ncbi:MAG: RimK/LysX family protein [Candidatus Saccharibacteria bacterium]|nr:RimK/LysX family protein [Candidatus Saccharibacteria bacterium]
MTTTKRKTLIGRAEEVRFPGLGNCVLPARIDTGAKTSSIWATDITETPEGLRVRFASPSHDIYQHEMLFPHYEQTAVASSNGSVQLRYKVRISMVLQGRRIRAAFTLADRSTQAYPVLIGRSALHGKFVVDVQERGATQHEAELKRSATLRKEREQS